MDIPIYQFTEEEISLAHEQAEAQCSSTGGKVKNKKKGNLGEVCFDEYCEKNLSDTIEKHWLNEQAMVSSRPECHDHDFKLNETTVDVKTRTDIIRFHQDQFNRDVKPSNDGNTSIYVFVLIHHQFDWAIILGWVRQDEIISRGFPLYPETHGRFSSLRFREMRDLNYWL